MDLEFAKSAYHQNKDRSIYPSIDSLSNLVSLSAGLGEQGSGSGPPRTQVPPVDVEFAVELFQDLRTAVNQRAVQTCPTDVVRAPLPESCYTALIRCFSTNERLGEAMELYHEMRDLHVSPKLRTMSPLIIENARLEKSDVCFDLMEKLTDEYDIVPSEKEYTAMLTLTQSTNDRRFLDVAREMISDIYFPEESATFDVLRRWFAADADYEVFESEVSDAGDLLSKPESVAAVGKLRSVELSPEDRDALLDQVEQTAVDGKPRRRKVRARKGVQSHSLDSAAPAASASSIGIVGDNGDGNDSERRPPPDPEKRAQRANESWQRFKAFLDHRKGMFNVVVDGANVGYFKMNYAGAPTHVEYHQIDWVVRHLQSIGLKPLLVLHSRHLKENVLPNNTCRSIVNKWREEGLLYSTPAGQNDDWFWLFAAVTMRCHVVTNDEMRDHHFLMLSPR